jgi:hypothetical protein
MPDNHYLKYEITEYIHEGRRGIVNDLPEVS